MKHPVCGLLLGTALSLSSMTPAFAQSPASASTQETQYQLDIPVQPLNKALRALSEATGLQFTYTAELVRDVNSRAIAGQMSATAALQRMLEGSGLIHRFVRERVVTLEKAPDGARVLGPVRVEGATAASAGANGSRDRTATENTGSYTASALTIGSKTAQSIRETPQSVSVVTQQQMKDQNLTDLRSVLNQATGITLQQSATNSTNYFARGFRITTFQIDGGTALIGDGSAGSGSLSSFYPLMSMATYDHVEVLRGADGIFNGYGDPGGSVSLSRKRPLDHPQVLMEVSGGSWSHYSTTFDGTAPLAMDGRLRGRAVFNYEKKDFFYDTAQEKTSINYGILELDVTPETLVTAGVTYGTKDTVPWLYALPRYGNGDDLRLPRSTCTCLSWNRQDFIDRELFTTIEQQFGSHWEAKASLTQHKQTSYRKGAYGYGAILPDEGTGQYLSGYTYPASSKQQLGEITLSGEFSLFGQTQKLLVGANARNVDVSGTNIQADIYPYPGPTFDIFHFNEADFPEPATVGGGPIITANIQRQRGAFASLRLTPINRLHVDASVRYSEYRMVTDTDNSYYGGPVSHENSTDHDFTWPPTWSLSYDLRPDLTVYGSVTDIYQQQDNLVDFNLKKIAPLTGTNFEGGIKFASDDGRLNASLALYRVERNNFPQFLGYGDYEATFGQVRPGVACCYDTDENHTELSQGLDAEIGGELLPRWQVSAGYTFNQNSQRGSYYGPDEGASFNSITPKHMLKLFTSYRFDSSGRLGRLTIGGGVNGQTKNFVSGSACTAYAPAINPDTGLVFPECQEYSPFQYTQDQYAIVSLHAGYQLDDRWSANLNVGNLLDTAYYQTMGGSDGGNFYGEPRSYMLSVRGTF